jgi:hypothetical protein
VPSINTTFRLFPDALAFIWKRIFA